MKSVPKLVLVALVGTAAGVAGSAIYQKLSESKVIATQKAAKPVVQPQKESPKPEEPKKDQPKTQPAPQQQVQKPENKVADANAKTISQRKPASPSHRELKKFWDRMYELNGELNNVDNDGFFAQYEISWIEDVRKQLHSMKVPNDPQAQKYHRIFKDRMDTVWYWIMDGNDDMQAQRVLNDWGYESQLLFADEYKHSID